MDRIKWNRDWRSEDGAATSWISRNTRTTHSATAPRTTLMTTNNESQRVWHSKNRVCKNSELFFLRHRDVCDFVENRFLRRRECRCRTHLFSNMCTEMSTLVNLCRGFLLNHFLLALVLTNTKQRCVSKTRQRTSPVGARPSRPRQCLFISVISIHRQTKHSTKRNTHVQKWSTARKGHVLCCASSHVSKLIDVFFLAPNYKVHWLILKYCAWCRPRLSSVLVACIGALERRIRGRIRGW